MARTNHVQLFYELDFDCVIRGHHVSKDFWTPVKGEVLVCQHDSSPEAQQHDQNSIGVFRNGQVVGHTPGNNVSALLKHFLMSHAEAQLIAIPTGKRKYEVGLVVPCKYKAMLPRANKCNIEILKQELIKIDNMTNQNVNIKVNSISKTLQ